MDWFGILLDVTFVWTELPQIMTLVQYLVHFCQIRIGKYWTFGLILKWSTTEQLQLRTGMVPQKYREEEIGALVECKFGDLDSTLGPRVRLFFLPKYLNLRVANLNNGFIWITNKPVVQISDDLKNLWSCDYSNLACLDKLLFNPTVLG